MKNLFTKYRWILIVILLPFIIMVLLHIGLALNQYTGFNFSVADVTAKDWFIFMGSYLGGCITLVGVLMSVRHSENIHNHQLDMQKLDDEVEEIVNAISSLRPMETKNIWDTYFLISEKGRFLNKYDNANISERITTQINNINNSRIRLMTLTRILGCNFNGQTCVKPCNLKPITQTFSEKYKLVTDTTIQALEKIMEQAELCGRYTQLHMDASNLNNTAQSQQQTDFYATLIKGELDEVTKKLDRINADGETLANLIKLCGNFNNQEIPEMIELCKAYAVLKKDNANNKCFKN